MIAANAIIDKDQRIQFIAQSHPSAKIPNHAEGWPVQLVDQNGAVVLRNCILIIATQTLVTAKTQLLTGEQIGRSNLPRTAHDPCQPPGQLRGAVQLDSRICVVGMRLVAGLGVVPRRPIITRMIEGGNPTGARRQADFSVGDPMLVNPVQLVRGNGLHNVVLMFKDLFPTIKKIAVAALEIEAE